MRTISRREFLKTSTAAAVTAGTAVNASAERRMQDRSSDQPNILFFFSDQHRFDWVSSSSRLPIRTPNLHKLAARGVQFTRAYCASPLCGPSRACLAAGKEYDRCRVPRHGIPYPADQTTFYELLREAGYHVMGCGKFDLNKGAREWGVEGQQDVREWGFSDGINNAGKWDAIYEGPPLDPFNAYLEEEGLRQVHYNDMDRRRDKPRLDPKSWGHYKGTFATDLPEHAYCDNWIARNGLKLIRRAPADQPWFLQVNLAGPHEPVDITRRMQASLKARGEVFPQPNRNTQLEPEKHNTIRANYTAMIENIDRWLGIYLDELDKRGELENTIIVYSSDHGEMLGDHNRWAKSMPYEPSVGVPLIVAGPDVQEDCQTDALASVMDLSATFLEAAGESVPQSMDAQSLMPLLSGKTNRHRQHLFSGLYGWRTVTDGRYKLIRGFNPEKGPIHNEGDPAFDRAPAMLFDLKNDPLENRNLADQMSKRVSKMTGLLRKI